MFFLYSARNKIAREEMQMPRRIELVQFEDMLDSSTTFERRGVAVKLFSCYSNDFAFVSTAESPPNTNVLQRYEEFECLTPHQNLPTIISIHRRQQQRRLLLRNLHDVHHKAPSTRSPMTTNSTTTTNSSSNRTIVRGDRTKDVFRYRTTINRALCMRIRTC